MVQSFTVWIIKTGFWCLYWFSEILKFFSQINSFVEIFHCIQNLLPFSPILSFLIGRYIPFASYSTGALCGPDKRKSTRNSYTSGIRSVIFQFLAALLSWSSRNEILVSLFRNYWFLHNSQIWVLLECVLELLSSFKNVAMNFSHTHRMEVLFCYWVLNALGFRKLSLSLKQ